MKKMGKMLLLTILSSCLYSTVASAGFVENWEYTASQDKLQEESKLLPKGVTQDNKRDNVTRGRYIASSGLGLSNEGYGILGVYADTLAHEPVEKIRIKIYLDQWDEADEDWIQIDSIEIEEEDKDGTNDLTTLTAIYNVENLETGKYYRLRGLHAVWSFDGYLETHATMTNGLLLTDGPA